MAVSLEAIRDLIRGFAKTGLWPDEICESVSRYLTNRAGQIRLPLAVRFRLWVRGYHPILALKTSKWGPIEFCLVRCPMHGVILDYPHGHRRYFDCPLCREETFQIARELSNKLNNKR